MVHATWARAVIPSVRISFCFGVTLPYIANVKFNGYRIGLLWSAIFIFALVIPSRYSELEKESNVVKIRVLFLFLNYDNLFRVYRDSLFRDNEF